MAVICIFAKAQIRHNDKIGAGGANIADHAVQKAVRFHAIAARMIFVV